MCIVTYWVETLTHMDAPYILQLSLHTQWLFFVSFFAQPLVEVTMCLKEGIVLPQFHILQLRQVEWKRSMCYCWQIPPPPQRRSKGCSQGEWTTLCFDSHTPHILTDSPIHLTFQSLLCSASPKHIETKTAATNSSQPRHCISIFIAVASATTTTTTTTATALS